MNSDTLTIAQIIEGLKKKSSEGNNFAASLLSGYTKYKSFSIKQQPWAEKLAREALFPETVVRPAGENLGGDFKELIKKFETAKNNGLKRPALTFNLTNIGKTKIYPAGDNSANRGFLYVKSGEQYFGKISNEGILTKGRDCNDIVIEFLKNISKDVVGYCTKNGKESGQCVFCARELTDSRSIRMGYGKICSTKWGLYYPEK